MIEISLDKKSRKVDKDLHRKVLLDATSKVVMEHGISGTTISKIQQESNLSRGMINLHFESKSNLLDALVVYLGANYNSKWQAISDEFAELTSPEAAASRLKRILEADLSGNVLNTDTAKICFVFRADRKLQKKYPHYIDTRNTPSQAAIRACCDLLCEASGSDLKPERVTAALLSMQEGFWTDFHMHPDNFNREHAIQICLMTAKAFFPKYF